MQEFLVLLTGAYGNSAPLDRRPRPLSSGAVSRRYEPWNLGLAKPFPYQHDTKCFLKDFELCEGFVFSVNRVSTIAFYWKKLESALKNDKKLESALKNEPEAEPDADAATKDAKVRERDQYIKWIDALVFTIARSFKDMVESFDLIADCSNIPRVEGTPPWMQQIRSDLHIIIQILKKMYIDMKEMGIQTSCDAHRIANLLMHGELTVYALSLSSVKNGVEVVNLLTNNSLGVWDQVLHIQFIELLPSALKYVITCRIVPVLPQSGQGSTAIMAHPSGNCPFRAMPPGMFMFLFKVMHLKDTLNLASTCKQLRYLYAYHATKRRASVLQYATCLVNKCNEVQLTCQRNHQIMVPH